MTLTQKHLFTSREFRLEEHGLRCNIKTIKERHENTIPYEDIYADYLTRRAETSWVSILSFLFLSIAFMVNLVAIVAGEKENIGYSGLTVIFILLMFSLFSFILLNKKEFLFQWLAKTVSLKL